MNLLFKKKKKKDLIYDIKDHMEVVILIYKINKIQYNKNKLIQ